MTADERLIIHADVDAFYASVEQRDRPELRGRALAVGGPPESRGVIMTASYEARRFGVHSAMPSRTARRLCPQLLIVPARFGAYQAASRMIMDIFRRHARLVEPLSLDEAFLDIADRADSIAAAEDLGRLIKEQVLSTTGLTVSLGIGHTKLLAKIASDFEKPDGLTAVPRERALEFLAPLPVRRLWGVGPKSEQAMRQAGLERIGQLQTAQDDWILQHLGPWGLRWRSLARCEDDREVSTPGKTKQMSRETTFARDTADDAEIRRILAEMASSLSRSLNESSPARTVHIKIRYRDFTTITRQITPGQTIRTQEDIAGNVFGLLEKSWNGRPVRLVGIGLSNFVEEPSAQLPLFEL